jgi:Arc/MetJ-type ribon-helix-helix transcriptional regulator
MAKFSISLPDSLTEQLDQQVTLQHCGRSKVIQDALSGYLEAGAGQSRPTRAVSAPAPEPEQKVQQPEDHPLHKTVQAHQTHLEELTAHLDSMREAMAEMIRSSGATLSDKLAQMLGKNGSAPAKVTAEPEKKPVTKKAAATVVAVKVPGKRGPKPGAKAAKAAAAALAARAEEAPKVRAKPGPKPGSKSAPRAAKVAAKPKVVRAKAPEAAPVVAAAPAAASRWQITPKAKK